MESLWLLQDLVSRDGPSASPLVISRPDERGPTLPHAITHGPELGRRDGDVV